MDIQELLTAFGKYYLNNGQNLKRIKNMPFQGEVLTKYATLIKTDETVYRLAQARINSIVQSFQKTWTPKNAAKFVPKEIRQYHFKIDEDVQPDDIEASWLGFLASSSQKRTDWPLIKYLIETLYMPQIQKDMELKEYYKGVFIEPEIGNAGSTGSSMNGIQYLLKEGVENSTINSIHLGPLHKDTIFDQIELFADSIAEEFQGMGMNVMLSPKWHREYMRDKRAQGFYQIDGAAQIKNDIDFTPFSVVGIPGMYGTDDIFATPKENLLHLTKKSENKTNVHLEESKRTVSFMTDWWEGLGFGINEAVWTNIRPSGSGSGSGS